MIFEHTEQTKYWVDRVDRFMDEHIFPNEDTYKRQKNYGYRRAVVPIIEEVKAKAKAEGLWNLFMPPHSGQVHVDDTFHFEGPQLSNVAFAAVAERLSRVGWASEALNSMAPDTGNMEVLMRYGTLEQ